MKALTLQAMMTMNLKQLKQLSNPDIVSFLIDWIGQNDIEIPSIECKDFPAIFSELHRQLIRLGEPPYKKIWTTQENYKLPFVVHKKTFTDRTETNFSIRLERLEDLELWFLAEYLKTLPSSYTAPAPTPTLATSFAQSSFL